MRSIALAEACRAEGGAATFAIASGTASLIDRIRAAGFDVVRVTAEPGSQDDALRTAAIARHADIAWVAADGYQFADQYQQTVTDAGLRLLVADDFGHATRYTADVILNQNLSARPSWYAKRPPTTKLLLGPRYALLRSEFRRYVGWRREVPDKARHLLITLGGSDPDNVTAKVLAALDGSELGLDIRTVVGGSYRHELPVPTAIRDASDMAELMAWADVAIAAGGSSAWELAFMGLPSLTLVLAENQIEIAAALDRAGPSINLGEQAAIDAGTLVSTMRGLISDAERRQKMSDLGRQLVDGRGTSRVLAEMALVMAGREPRVDRK
jgi:UDP-2,4-diacetamido-2,4,6-trideoxy-beta-L-altropyranose hydrolase